ncbi:hypothetical protein CupriaWKF_22115 [Cupriavidus sp. WKF15]|uniref:hypothetical protein n=1 Tax=Cupriavidus sp. WKF15 TaxID=3032282 RepID=UPI0023E1F20E|nr:hypothetical protein [Cupriavidus sp. WKF15]WER49822.1 hypothetical protein CupriaWKF_22115 [Cupriavidus sp. WKF15]
MARNHKFGRKLEMAAVAFATGFSAHGHTSSSLGVLAGTLAVCALVARSAFNKRSPTAGLVLLPQT